MVNLTILILPLLLLMVLILAIVKKESPYESFVSGVKNGFWLFKELFPSMLAMMLAINLLGVSGLIDDIGDLLSNIFPNSKIITNLTPMLIFRPLSGSASTAILYNVCSSNGADSLICRAGSALQGSTDTTFYIIALYFGSVGVKKWRHSIKAGLTADFVGMFVAIILALIVFS